MTNIAIFYISIVCLYSVRQQIIIIIIVLTFHHLAVSGRHTVREEKSIENIIMFSSLTHLSLSYQCLQHGSVILLTDYKYISALFLLTMHDHITLDYIGLAIRGSLSHNTVLAFLNLAFGKMIKDSLFLLQDLW